jgi:HAD superfamily hydrolase (TIGR01509 family)
VKIRHVIFDCDGVLVDSEEISMVVDGALLAENGVAISHAEMHRRFVGKTFQGMVDEIEAERGVKLPGDLEARKDVLMLEAYRRELQAVAGVAEALAEIKLPKSIGTNGPRHRALEALRIVRIDHHFLDRMTTFEDVVNGKPAPDIYLLAARRAGLAPEHCLVVEDSVTGATAAVRAGCPTLGFTGTHADRAEHAMKLVQAGCYRVFDDMAELPGIIASLC